MNLQLSDGTTMQIPDDATPEMIKNFAARGEAYAKSNPVTPAPQEADPYSARNTTGRIATDAALGIPDLAVAGHNTGILGLPGTLFDKGLRAIGVPLPELNRPRIEPYAPQLREKLNVAELPEDAPWSRRILESGGSALMSGGSGIVRNLLTEGPKAGAKEFVKNTVVPTLTSDAGARVGGAIGGEAGQLIGGVIGGSAPNAKPSNWIQGRYVGKGDPNAPQIAAAADRLGIEPTAGALGNYDIQKRENAFAATRPGGLAAREQVRIRNDMASVGDDIGVQRGGTGAGQAQIGDDIVGAAADRVLQDRQYSSAQQENLQRTVGDATPVPVWDIIQEARAAMNSPNATVPMRNSLAFRIENQLLPLITQRGPDGAPIIDQNATVPYGALKGWRSDLGRSFDQGNQPRARELYEPATDAMASTAEQAGVPRGEFNQVQSFTRGVEGEGGLADRLAPFAEKEPAAAARYTIDNGLNNPERVQTFATETAGDPRQGRAFGNYLQNLADEKLGPRGGGVGPRNFADTVQNADPRAIDAIAGPQAGRLQDLATLARGVDVPVNQRGLGTSVGGVANSIGGRFLGSEVLGQVGAAIDPILGPAFRGIGWGAKPALDWAQQRIMQSDAAKRGLLGAPMMHRAMTIDDLVRTLSIIGQNQQQQQVR